MLKIILGNNKSRLIGPTKHTDYIRDKFKIREQNYFWSLAYKRRQWDGYKRYISEVGGLFSTGLLDQVVALLKKEGYKYKIEDTRQLFYPRHEVTDLGDLTLRKDQVEAVESFLSHKVAGVSFSRGIMAEATNTGKSLIAAAIVASFRDKREGIILVDSKDLYQQALVDFGKLFPGEVGEVNADRMKIRRITICMVQTLGRRIVKFANMRNWLAKLDWIVVDEGDKLIGRKDCKKILGFAYNAPIRICLSGTPLTHKGNTKQKDEPHKGSTRNQELLAYFGPVIHRRTNKENVEEGISAKPHITFRKGNEKRRLVDGWKDEYDSCITKNKARNRKVWEIVRDKINREKLPLVILFKFHQHGRILLKRIPPDIMESYRVELIHGKVSNRYRVIEDFNKGKVDILIASLIIERGLNLPRMRCLINASAGDSERVVLQIFGRTLRTKKGKKHVDLDDFMDEGKYIGKHSKHRLKYYKNQGFEVKELG